MTDSTLAPPPRWQDLLARFLARQQLLPDVPMSEVELYQAQPALGLDESVAWSDALAPGRLLNAEWPDSELSTPWVQYARQLRCAQPFPCCVGLAPQLLHSPAPLLRNPNDFFLKPFQQTPASPLALAEDTPLPIRLAICRVAGDFHHVEEMLNEASPTLGKLICANERAAQAWLTGQFNQAEQIWSTLPADHPVTALNLALSALRRGEIELGKQYLLAARQTLPESSGWRHLAELYLVALDVV